MTSETVDEYLEKLYFDPSRAGSLSGPDKLYRTVRDEGKFKIGRRKIRQFLNDLEEYSVQRDLKRKRKRRRIEFSGVHQQWAVDLADVQNLMTVLSTCSSSSTYFQSF